MKAINDSLISAFIPAQHNFLSPCCCWDFLRFGFFPFFFLSNENIMLSSLISTQEHKNTTFFDTFAQFKNIHDFPLVFLQLNSALLKSETSQNEINYGCCCLCLYDEVKILKYIFHCSKLFPEKRNNK